LFAIDKDGSKEYEIHVLGRKESNGRGEKKESKKLISLIKIGKPDGEKLNLFLDFLTNSRSS